jgi:hypothetical protein
VERWGDGEDEGVGKSGQLGGWAKRERRRRVGKILGTVN